MVKFFAMEVNKSRTGSSNNGIEAKGNRTATMEIPMLYNFTWKLLVLNNADRLTKTNHKKKGQSDGLMEMKDDGVQCQIFTASRHLE